MAAGKKKKGKAKGKPQGKKSRLWVRDLLNLVGGLLVGSIGLWLVLAYLDNRETDKAKEKYLVVIDDARTQLNPLAEKYLSLTEGNKEGNKEGDIDVSEGKELDISQPVFSLESVKALTPEVCALPEEAIPSFLEFYQNLQKAELLRKLLKEQQEGPAEFAQTLENQFLRSVYEDSRLASGLYWKLKK